VTASHIVNEFNLTQGWFSIKEVFQVDVGSGCVKLQLAVFRMQIDSIFPLSQSHVETVRGTHIV